MYINEAVFALEACVCGCYVRSPNTASVALGGILVLRKAYLRMDIWIVTCRNTNSIHARTPHIKKSKNNRNKSKEMNKEEILGAYSLG